MSKKKSKTRARVHTELNSFDFIVEKYGNNTEWHDCIKNAAVFEMTEKKQKIMMEKVVEKYKANPNYFFEYFRLPFKNVAIHITDAIFNNKLPGNITMIAEELSDSINVLFCLYCSPLKRHNVMKMKIDKPKIGRKIEVNCEMVGMFEDGRVFRIDDEPKNVEKNLSKDCEIEAQIIIGLFSIINNTEDFIVECTNIKNTEKYNKSVKGYKKQRSPYKHERPEYRMMDLRTIHKLIGKEEKSESTGRHNKSHPVRGHFRNLTSDYYVNKKGTRKWIESYWCGPKENTVGNIKYRVIVD